MSGVVEIEFADIAIQIAEDAFAFPCEGSAEIDPDGAVVAISLDVSRRGYMDRMRFDVPVDRRRRHERLIDRILVVLAETIESECKEDIQFRMADWEESLAIREYEAAE